MKIRFIEKRNHYLYISVISFSIGFLWALMHLSLWSVIFFFILGIALLIKYIRFGPN